MNRLTGIIIIALMLTFFQSCINEPPVLPGLEKSSIVILSHPDSAVISLNNGEKNFITPGIATNLEPGFYKIDLQKYAYIDTTIYYILSRGSRDTVLVELRENPPFWWKVFSMHNSALPTNSVGKLTKDKNNHLWIATSLAGLIRYDGNTFLVFNTNNSGIASNVIRNVFADHQSFLWVCTREGLCRYDGSEWITYNSSNSGWADQDITSFIIDKTNIIWIGTVNGGLIKFDGSSFIEFNTSNSPMPANHVTTLAVTDDNTLYIGTWGGGLVTNKNGIWNIFSTSTSNLSNPYISEIITTPDGNIWLANGSVNTFGGVSKFDGSTFINYIIFSVNGGRMATGLVSDHKGNLWISTTIGILKFDGISWTSYHTGNSGLPSNGTVDILIDDQEYKWISTTGGIARYSGG